MTGIPMHLIEIDKIKFSERVIPIYLEQVQNDTNGKIWIISRNTIQKLNISFEKAGSDLNTIEDSTMILSSRYKGDPVEDRIVMIIIALVSFSSSLES